MGSLPLFLLTCLLGGAAMGTLVAWLERFGVAEMWSELKRPFRAVHHVTSAWFRHEDDWGVGSMEVRRLQDQLWWKRVTISLLSVLAFGMGLIGRQWGEHTEHELHAGLHDCKVVVGSASSSVCNKSRCEVSDFDCVEGDRRAWRERQGIRLDVCHFGAWVPTSLNRRDLPIVYNDQVVLEDGRANDCKGYWSAKIPGNGGCTR